MALSLRNHILYVEDHADTREMVSLVLAAQKYQVTATSTVAEGLRMARQEVFHLYLLDSWLPDGSGVELCKMLREFDTTTPIVFLSGAAYQADEHSALSNGAQRYFVKPVDIDLLSIEIARLIHNIPQAMQHVLHSPSLTANNSTVR